MCAVECEESHDLDTVQVGGEHSPVAALGKPHTTLSSVHMLNINPPMHNPSGHLPHTFYIAHSQGLKF